MPTTVTKTIGSTGDYSTIQLWEDAAPANLVTSDQVWEGQLQNQTFSVSSGQVCTFAGSTVDSTHFKRLTCVAGASFRDNANVQTNALRYNTANGAAITTSTAYGAGLLIQEQYVQVLGLQMEATVNSCGVISMQQPNITVKNCIFEYKKSLGVAIETDTMINCLFINRNGAINMVNFSGGSPVFTNCTFVTPSNLTKAATIFTGNYASPSSTNCAFFGCTALKSGTSTYTYLACASDVASPPANVTAMTYDTALFVNITDSTRDYRLPSGSGLIDVGFTSTSASPDIAGTTRPQGSQYDIGCWEYVSAAAFKSFFTGAANGAFGEGARAA